VGKFVSQSEFAPNSERFPAGLLPGRVQPLNKKNYHYCHARRQLTDKSKKYAIAVLWVPYLLSKNRNSHRIKHFDKLSVTEYTIILTTFDFRLSTFDFRLSTFDFRLSTFDFRLTTYDLRLTTYDLPLYYAITAESILVNTFCSAPSFCIAVMTVLLPILTINAMSLRSINDSCEPFASAFATADSIRPMSS
jgi:hypothetical protein